MGKISLEIYDKFFKLIPDHYREAELCAERKRSLRQGVHVNYCEREKKVPTTNRPQSDYAETKQSIKIKVERISNLKKAINIRNQQRDKIKIDDIDDVDVEKIQELIEESDDEMPPIIDEAGPSQQPNNEEEADSIIEIISPNGAIASTSNMDCADQTTRMETDKEFSLEYSYTTDVSTSIIK